jgi:hypothetical protein
MVYENISADLPKQFFYNLKKLKGGFSKQIIKITPDRVLASPNDITTFRFPIGSVLNLQSLNLHFKGSTKGTNPTLFPKYTSTLIKRLSVSVNNVSVQIINDYNIVYNTYADLNSANLTTRHGEKFDTTTSFSNTTLSSATTTASPLVGTNLLLASTGLITNERMVINHFLGILGGGSTPVCTDVCSGKTAAGGLIQSVYCAGEGIFISSLIVLSKTLLFFFRLSFLPVNFDFDFDKKLKNKLYSSFTL